MGIEAGSSRASNALNAQPKLQAFSWAVLWVKEITLLKQNKAGTYLSLSVPLLHSPHHAMFACYFWQGPQNSAPPMNWESEKSFWPLLYKER